jgi:hypothetical protein
LLDPETIPTWRTPRGMSIEIEHFQPRPGGTYRMVLSHAATEGAHGKSQANGDIINGQFAEILPDTRITEAV